MWEKIEDRNYSDTARYKANGNTLTADGPDEFMWHITKDLEGNSEFNEHDLRWLVIDLNTQYSTFEPECRIMLGTVPLSFTGSLEDMIHLTTFILYSGRPDEVIDLVTEKLTLSKVFCKRIKKESQPDPLVSA